MAACRIQPLFTAGCDWEATPGEVTLRIKSLTGTIAFEPQSTYSDGPITFNNASEITFTIVPGKSKLDIVYVFTDTDNGAGTLEEVCDSPSVLDDLHADTAAEQYDICA